MLNRLLVVALAFIAVLTEPFFLLGASSLFVIWLLCLLALCGGSLILCFALLVTAIDALRTVFYKLLDCWITFKMMGFI